MGSVFFVVGPVRGENLVGLAAEQEVEFLLEDAVDLFEGLLIEIGHRPAAELEAFGRILGRPARRLHDAIHGNLGADDNLSHGSRSSFEPGRTTGFQSLSRHCALCHGGDGAEGAKLSWKPMGTVWARNLTTNRETGLGAWTDAEIARAIRSGIAKDGRALHWQAMIWDHASNWDEEDVRAMVAFLRVLPPVRRAIPPPRPPDADDCEVYTFWVAASGTPGCR